MFEQLEDIIPKVKINYVELGIVIFIIICSIFYGYSIGNGNSNKQITNLNNQIQTLNNTIEKDKQVANDLQQQLQQKIALIKPAKIAAKEAKDTAEEDVKKIEHNEKTRTSELPDIQIISADYGIALKDEENTTDATQEALDKAKEEIQAQEQIVASEDILNKDNKAALDLTNKMLATETRRKKAWRDTAIGGIIIILGHIILHI